MGENEQSRGAVEQFPLQNSCSDTEFSLFAFTNFLLQNYLHPYKQHIHLQLNAANSLKFEVMFLYAFQRARALIWTLEITISTSNTGCQNGFLN